MHFPVLQHWAGCYAAGAEGKQRAELVCNGGLSRHHDLQSSAFSLSTSCLPEMVSPYPWTLSIGPSAGNLMHSPRVTHFFPAVCLSLQPRLCLRSTLSFPFTCLVSLQLETPEGGEWRHLWQHFSAAGSHRPLESPSSGSTVDISVYNEKSKIPAFCLLGLSTCLLHQHLPKYLHQKVAVMKSAWILSQADGVVHGHF